MTNEKKVVIVDGIRTPIGAYTKSLECPVGEFMSEEDLKNELKREEYVKELKKVHEEYIKNTNAELLEKIKELKKQIYALTKEEPPVTMLKDVFHGLMQKTGLEAKLIDEVIVGQVIGSRYSLNPANVFIKMLARDRPDLYACLNNTSAFTVSRNCSSGYESVDVAAMKIKLGRYDIAVVGGAEHMSAYSFEELQLGLTCIICKDLMAITAERLANDEKYGSSQEEQYGFAINSQRKALDAIKKGIFKEEIIPIKVRKKDKISVFETDEQPVSKYIPNSYLNAELQYDYEKLFNELTEKEGGELKIKKFGKIFAKFLPEKCKKISASNSCNANDGAALLLIMSEEKAKKLGYKPLVEIVGGAAAGVPAEVMGSAPSASIPKLLKYFNLRNEDIGLYEINAPFAAVALYNQKRLQIDPRKLNVNGDCIALGHPVGMTGTRLLLTMAYEMKRRGIQYGVTSACAGGGQATAVLLKLLE